MTEGWEPQLPPSTHAPRPARSGFPLMLTVVVALAMALLVGLGDWQLQRLKWKEDLLARIAALQSARPRALDPLLDARAHGRDIGFTRVKALCPGLAHAPFLELYGLHEGQAGVRLISACAVESAAYRTVLVDRGFVADTDPTRPPVDAGDHAAVELVGVIRNPEPATFVTPANQPASNHWFSRDVAAMAQALKAPGPAAPVYLMAETSSNPEWPGLVPAPLPSEIPNRHLEYAITWFGLAGTLGCVYAAVLIRDFRRGRRKSQV